MQELHIYIHIVPSAEDQSIPAQLKAIVKSQGDMVKALEKLGAGGLSAADTTALAGRATQEADKVEGAAKSVGDISK